MSDGTNRMNGADAMPLLVDRRGLAGLLSVSVATLSRMASGGKLPREIRVSAGRIAWRRSTIEAWIGASEKQGRLLSRGEWEQLQANA